MRACALLLTLTRRIVRAQTTRNTQFVKFGFLVPVLSSELHRPGSTFFHLTSEQARLPSLMGTKRPK
jgi:hypothetical protein